MSLYDFFFPQQAAAEHLGRLVQHNSFSNTMDRVNQARTSSKLKNTEKRVTELENEVAQLTIVLEALLEVLGNDPNISKDAIARKIAEIDARDGVLDGKITKKEEPKEDDDGPSRPELLFPGK